VLPRGVVSRNSKVGNLAEYATSTNRIQSIGACAASCCEAVVDPETVG
jgi:hypothetical protein